MHETEVRERSNGALYAACLTCDWEGERDYWPDVWGEIDCGAEGTAHEEAQEDS